MPHIHTKPGEHDLTTSAFIVRLDMREPAIMLHRHKKLGKWIQFGGHVEVNETPWQAVSHEIVEESGYAMSQLQLLQPAMRPPIISDTTFHPQPLAIHTHPFKGLDHFHTDITFAFVTREAPLHAVADGESSIIQAFTAGELRTIPEDDIPDNVRVLALYVLDKCLLEYEQVSTATY